MIVLVAVYYYDPTTANIMHFDDQVIALFGFIRWKVLPKNTRQTCVLVLGYAYNKSKMQKMDKEPSCLYHPAMSIYTLDVCLLLPSV